MSLIKWNGNNVFPTFSSLVDSFFENDMLTRSSDATLVPAVNVKEEDNRFSIEVAAPGYKKEDFNVKIENGKLCISSETKEESEDTNDNYTRKEFSYKSFSRSFVLPENVNEDNIEAKYEEGILKLEIPKTVTKEVKDSKFIQIS